MSSGTHHTPPPVPSPRSTHGETASPRGSTPLQTRPPQSAAERAGLVVTCEGVARTFGEGERAVVAVHGSSCSVRFGTRTAIVGSSGSGKSTLLHILAGLERPTAGNVSWPGLSTTEHERQGQIGVVFQSPSLVPALTVAENAALPLVLAGLPEGETAERVSEALRLVHVEDLADQLPEELSGGQAQRVAVARVLARRPALILADEPTGQLDQASGQHLIDVLLATAEQIGAALVVSTHDTEVADRLDAQWRMHEGRLSVDDPDPRMSAGQIDQPAVPTTSPTTSHIVGFRR